MLTQSCGILDNLAEKENREMLASPRNQMLIDKLKEEWDDFNCLTVLRLNSLGTSQLTSGDIKEQLRASNKIVQSGKESERAVTIPGKSLETLLLTARDIEEQLNPHDKIFLLGKEIEREITTSKGVCFSDANFMVHQIHPTDMIGTTSSGSQNVPAHAGISVCNMQIQASKQPLSEEIRKISDQSIINLQLPLLSNVQMSGNALNFFHETGSLTNVQDSRSTTIGSSSTTNLPFHSNLMMPYREQLPCNDPLQIEIERLKTHYERDLKMHQAMILHMKWNRYKEVGELLKKYDIFFQDAEATFQHKAKDFKLKVQKVCQSKFLATAVMLKHNDHEEALAPETSRAASDIPNQLVQNSTQMSTDRLDQHPPVTAPSELVVNHPLQVPARPYSGGTLLSFTSGSYLNGFLS